MTVTPNEKTARASRSEVGASLDRLTGAAVQAVEMRVDYWSRRLDRLGSSAHGAGGGVRRRASRGVTPGSGGGGGALNRAAIRALAASLVGKNPVWAALKGVWSGASAWGKTIMVIAIVGLLLGVVLSPALLLLLLLASAIIVATWKIRAARA